MPAEQPNYYKILATLLLLFDVKEVLGVSFYCRYNLQGIVFFSRICYHDNFCHGYLTRNDSIAGNGRIMVYQCIKLPMFDISIIYIDGSRAVVV